MPLSTKYLSPNHGRICRSGRVWRASKTLDALGTPPSLCLAPNTLSSLLSFPHLYGTRHGNISLA